MEQTDHISAQGVTRNGGPVGALSVSDFARGFAAVADNVRLVIRGKDEVVDLALVCMLAEGHLLVEDVPGTGKTTLARALAASVDATYQRIQFTPDLLPSDVSGVSIYNQKTNEFEFHRGPVFANIVLGDEINRASPKTQSALLEVMEEQRVTVDGVGHAVPRPFMVVATQNPVDMDGTYALPEAQLDRFLMRISMGYPSEDAEIEVLEGRARHRRPEDLRSVVTADELRLMIAATEAVHAAPELQRYLVQVVAATRSLPDARLGASPRGSIALLRAVKVRAAAAGRDYATPEDVKALAVPVLAHRVLLSAEAQVRGVTQASLIERVLDTVAVPGELVA
ncbi:MAG TPA: MoxR family ATPase [Actinomycetales bacterium]|nr:MoxR family ATPase [Actinomycetales bacterium]